MRIKSGGGAWRELKVALGVCVCRGVIASVEFPRGLYPTVLSCGPARSADAIAICIIGFCRPTNRLVAKLQSNWVAPSLPFLRAERAPSRETSISRGGSPLAFCGTASREPVRPRILSVIARTKLGNFMRIKSLAPRRYLIR